MDSHDDNEHRMNETRKLYQAFKKRAEYMKARGLSQITSGAPGETPLQEWTHKNFTVREMRPDEIGVLRISIGGGGLMGEDTGYCVFRGNQTEVVRLLRSALRALEKG